MTQPAFKKNDQKELDRVEVYGALSQPVQLNKNIDVTEILEKDPSLSQFCENEGFIKRLVLFI